MHSSSTRTIKTVEHFDEEGKLFKRVTTETLDEFVDLDTDQPEAPDEKTLADPPVNFPFSSTPILPCINGFGCPNHNLNTYVGRSAG